MRCNKRLIIFLVACFITISFMASASIAESFEIGLNRIPEDLNIIKSEELSAQLVRDLIAEPLIRSSPTNPLSFDLVLADQFKSSQNYQRWDFRLRAGVLFHSGRAVTAKDIIFSLENCSKYERWREKAALSHFEEEQPGQINKTHWISLKVQDSRQPPQPKEIGELFSTISDCPIYSANEAKLFEGEFGKGTNVVTSGPYRMASFRTAKSIVLQRFPEYRKANRAPEQLTLRAFDKADESLTALRLGNVYLTFRNDDESRASALKDDTLAVAQCANYPVIYRKNFTFNCNNGLEPLSLKYNG